MRLVEHTGAERQERELGHLECLQAKGYADDGEAVDAAGGEIAQRHGNACADDPKHVGDERRRAAAVFDGLAERRERE